MHILLVCSWLQLVTPENEIYDTALLVVTGFVILSRFLLFFICVVIVLISLALYLTFCRCFDSNRKKVLVYCPELAEMREMRAEADGVFA
jgi:hypothetical protein